MDNAQIRERLQSAAYLVAAFCLGWLAAWAAYAPHDGSVSSPAFQGNAPAANATDYVNQCLRLINERHYPQAVDVCERGLLARPADSLLLNNLATARLLQGEIGKGEAILKKLVADAPDFQLAQNNLAWAKSLRAEVEAAIAANEKKLASAPDQAAKISALWAMAAGYAQLGENEKAVTMYDIIRKLDPGNASAINNSGVAHMALAQYAEALACFREAARLVPDQALYRNNIDWAQRTAAQSAKQ